MRCSRCGQKISDMVIELSSSVTPMKIINGGQLIPVENTSEPTREFLCVPCFNLYADCLDQLNQEYNRKYQVSMIEMVDDVQYGDGE